MYLFVPAYTMVEGLMNMSPGVGWVVTPIRLDNDNVAKQMKDIKERTIKNIVVYMHIEENIKVVVDHVSQLN